MYCTNAKLFELNPYVLRDPVLASLYQRDQPDGVGRSDSRRPSVRAALSRRRNETRLVHLAPQDANPDAAAAQTA